MPVGSPETRERPPAAAATPRRRRRRRPAILISVALALALFVAANALVKHYEDDLMRIVAYDNQYTAAHLVDYENGPPPDVVFLGSSRVSAGFQPSLMRSYLGREHGIDAHGMNLGIASGNLEASYMILKNVIRDSRKPRLIVYGLSEHELLPHPFSLDLDHLPHTEQFLSLDEFSEHSGDTLRGKASFLLDHLLPLYRDRDLVRDAFTIRFNERDPRHLMYSDGPYHLRRPPDGYWPIVGPAPPALIEAQKRLWGPQLARFTATPSAIQKLLRLIDLARARDIELVLVNMPAPPVLHRLWSSEAAVVGYQGVVAEIARRNDVALLDLYDPVPFGIPPDAFYDVNHLNPKGAALVTVLAADTLIAPVLRREEDERPAGPGGNGLGGGA